MGACSTDWGPVVGVDEHLVFQVPGPLIYLERPKVITWEPKRSDKHETQES